MFFIVGGWGVVGWGRKSYLGPAEITSFSRRDLSRRNKHDSFWHVASTWYFYVLVCWTIVVSDFLPLKIYKNLVLPLPSITFTANRQTDNHLYRYIYLFQILYSMKPDFYLNTRLVFSNAIWIAIVWFTYFLHIFREVIFW